MSAFLVFQGELSNFLTRNTSYDTLLQTKRIILYDPFLFLLHGIYILTTVI